MIQNTFLTSYYLYFYQQSILMQVLWSILIYYICHLSFPLQLMFKTSHFTNFPHIPGIDVITMSSSVLPALCCSRLSCCTMVMENILNLLPLICMDFLQNDLQLCPLSHCRSLACMKQYEVGCILAPVSAIWILGSFNSYTFVVMFSPARANLLLFLLSLHHSYLFFPLQPINIQPHLLH